MIQYKTDYLTVFQSELYETTSTVIEGKEAIIIVDPNWLPNEIAKIKEHVKLRLKNKQLYLVITHSDFDHIIGVGAFPEAIIIASEALKIKPNKKEILTDIFEFDQMYYVTRSYPIIFPHVNIAIHENETQLQLGDLECTFYLSPGHTDDGLFFYIKNLQTLIVGDYLSDVEFPFITSSYLDYYQTTQLMQKVCRDNKIALLIPGHGKVTKNYQKRIDFTLWYLDRIKNNAEIEQELMKRFPFYQGMKASHKNNLLLIKERD